MSDWEKSQSYFLTCAKQQKTSCRRTTPAIRFMKLVARRGRLTASLYKYASHKRKSPWLAERLRALKNAMCMAGTTQDQPKSSPGPSSFEWESCYRSSVSDSSTTLPSRIEKKRLAWLSS